MSRAKRNWLLFGSGVVFAAIVVGFLLMNFFLVSKEYDKAKAEYLGAGLPFEVKDLERNIPESDNAAGFLSRYKHESAAASVDLKFDSVKAHKEELKKLIDARGAELDAVVAGSQLKHLDWEHDWAQGTNIDFSRGMALKAMVRDLAVRAEIRTIEGDLEGAINDFRAMNRISEMISQEPTLIAMLVSTAVRSMVSSYALTLGTHRLSNPEFLKALSNELALIHSGPDLANAVRGEAYFNIWYLRNLKLLGGWIKALGPPDHMFSESEEPQYKGPFAPDGEIKGLAAKAMAVKTFRFYSDLYTILKTDQEWFTANAKISKRVNEAIADESLSGRGLSSGVGIYEQILIAPARSRAYTATARAALLLMASQAEGKGKLKLDDLEIKWNDPFSGGTLYSKWEGNAVKVWSVGEDGKDDGGLEKNAAGVGFGSAVGFDIVSTLPKAEPKRTSGGPPIGGPPTGGPSGRG